MWESRLRSGDRLLVDLIEFSVRDASPSELSKACEWPDTDDHKTIFDKLDGLSDAIQNRLKQMFSPPQPAYCPAGRAGWNPANRNSYKNRANPINICKRSRSRPNQLVRRQALILGYSHFSF